MEKDKEKEKKVNRPPEEIFDLAEDEIFGTLQESRGSTLFLGRFSLTEVKAFLAKKNFLREAKRRQLWPLVFSLDSSQFPVQRLQVFWEKKEPEKLIVDLKIKEGGFPANANRPLNPALGQGKFLHLEWLTLQNPRLEFTPQRPALPGQTRPGLGLGKKVVDIFIYLGKLTGSDGLLAFPAYFHNSLLFSRYFRFVNPAKEAEVLAIRTGLASIPFKQLAWLVFLNCVRLNDKPYEWKAEEQALPLSPELKDYFASKNYRETVQRLIQTHRVSVDWELFSRYHLSPSGAILPGSFADRA